MIASPSRTRSMDRRRRGSSISTGFITIAVLAATKINFGFSGSYFDENVPAFAKSTAGWYVLKLDNPDDAARVGKAIDTMFANSSSETKTETESAFRDWICQAIRQH